MARSATVGQLFAMLKLGRHAELERSARNLLATPLQEPGIVWKLLAGALAAQGKSAVAALRKAAEELPHDAEAHSNLGNALAADGDFEGSVASYRRALAAEPGAAELHVRLGDALRASGRLEQAISGYRRAIELDPGNAGFHNHLGSGLLDLGLPAEAAVLYRSALEIEPDFAAAHDNLGVALRYLGQFDAAESCSRQALALDPNLAGPHYNLAILLKLQSRTEEAEAHCRSALRINPGWSAAHVLLSKFCADRGEFAKGQALLEQVIAKDPDSSEAWSGIPHLRRMCAGDAAWLSGALRLAASNLPARKEARLRFAIGKYFDDVHDYPRAFENYRRANDLVKGYRPPHDTGAFTQTVDRVTRAFGPAWVSRSRRDGITSSRPVFIVGMPRSGTTLAEQILAAHPAVCGANELVYWGMATAAQLADVEAGEVHGDTLGRLANDYLRLLQGLSARAQRVVDKMPINFLSLGLIHAALPDARFIHMRRHPIDTCLSIYFQDFDDTYRFANDLDHLAHYYRDYLRVMAHWRSVVPADHILDLSYEDLVDDPETRSRAMVEFLDLTWDPRCLDFHSTRRTVNTASNWQVRQKIGKSSVARWRNYAAFVGPLARLVQPSL